MNDTANRTSPQVLRRIYHFLRYVWRASPAGGRIDTASAWAIAKAVA